MAVRVQGAERLAALALASVGVASLLLYLARPATIILWTQDPCQSVPKDMTGCWGFLIGVVLALGAALVAVRRRGAQVGGAAARSGGACAGRAAVAQNHRDDRPSAA